MTSPTESTGSDDAVGSASAYSSGAEASDTGTGMGESVAEVSLRWLSPAVRKRVEAIREADLKNPRNNNKRRVEWRYTDWSEPSDTVSVPTRVDQLLAGTVTAPKTTRIDENTSFAKEEPKGKLVVSQWIPYYAVDVPAEREVTLGSILNFEADADVLHPIKLIIRRIEKHRFQTDSIVLDMRGGDPLPGGDKENLIAAPGEFLVVDADGRLRTQSELDDMDELRMKLLIPDDEDVQADDGLYGGESSGDGVEPGDDIYDASSPTGTSPGRRPGRREGS